MLNLIILLLKYFFGWLFICSAIALALASESLASYVFKIVFGGQKGGLAYPTGRLRSFYYERGLYCSFARVLIYAPALALAALLPVCAAVPFFSFFPILNNGADTLQIIQFMLLSDVVVFAVFYAVATEESFAAAKKQILNTTRLILPMLIYFVSLVAYGEALGNRSDIFSINSLSGLTMSADSSLFFAASFLFVFAILSGIPHLNESYAVTLLENGEVRGLFGLSRFILEVWAIFRAFIVIAIMVNILFPSAFLNHYLHISGQLWLHQFALFLCFWSITVFTRVFIVPLCWKLSDRMAKLLPKPFSDYALWILTGSAALLMFIEIVNISAETAAY